MAVDYPCRTVLVRPFFTIVGIILLLAIAGLASGCGTTTLTVDGLVVDSDTGKPVPGATVQATNDKYVSSARTDDLGKYHLEGVPTKTSITVSADRYREAKFDVNEDGEFTTKLELITYTVEGTVKDAYTDKPLADVKVAVG
ncbi:MAG: carboxypeptidase-like regulatory domain-containing protein, partial [Dehalococcoidales bacterium]|nr:carboxypeptidase-like regulatory domain-containing protein [Dehalococcoidales bacterium]